MIPEDEARRLLGEELREQLDRDPEPNPIWLALHIGCAASALGIDGRIEPAISSAYAE